MWVAPPLRGDEVDRPGLMADLLAAVTRPEVSAVGMTTGLWGAGGFGRAPHRVTLPGASNSSKRSMGTACHVSFIEAVGDPRSVALLVYDMQVGILDQVDGPLAAADVARLAAGAVRR